MNPDLAHRFRLFGEQVDQAVISAQAEVRLVAPGVPTVVEAAPRASPWWCRSPLLVPIAAFSS